MKTRRSVVTAGVWAGAVFVSTETRAWTFPEHTRLTQAALVRLQNDPQKAEAFQRIFAVVNRELLLLTDPNGKCPSYATLPSLAADHSCTPHELRQRLANIRDSDNRWIFGVLDVARRAGRELAKAASDAAAREEVRRQMHVDLQFDDNEYVDRTRVDYSHFQVTREDILLGGEGLTGYLELALSPQRESNAVAAYANYHMAAVLLAAQAGAKADDPGLWARAFVAEAFALHFLQDAFSSGHFVGHWGDDSVRLGSHDYYSAAGFETTRWGHPRKTYLAHGDGFLSDEETEVIAIAVSKSLWQVIAAGTNDDRARQILAGFSGAFATENYDSCRAELVPPGLGALAGSKQLREIVEDQPVPARRSPEIPRVRAESGMFFGAAVSFQPSFVANEKSFGARVLGTIRAGYGAAGLVNDPLNSQLFFDIGPVAEHLPTEDPENLLGWTARAKVPAFVVPGDGLLGIPLALIFKSDCPFCVAWAAAAASGGAGRLWRAMRLFGNVRWQFSALRDATVNYLRADGNFRLELLAPIVTARLALPMGGGSQWSQSTDFYLDAGGSLTWATGHPAYPGVFMSFSAAARVFP